MTETNTPLPKVQNIEINADNAGQRIDNYLLSKLKGVPKSRIYKILRSGEVRVNKGRIKPSHRLTSGDIVRIPPVRVSEEHEQSIPSHLIQQLDHSVLFENDDLIILNKPAGMAVHAGSNVAYGVIDILRAERFQDAFIELVHRLDRETSGCLVLAKNRQALVSLQNLFKSDRAVTKQYLALTMGHWPDGETRVDLPLAKNEMQGGERMVTVSDQGKSAISLFVPTEQFENCSLVEVTLLTGRTHQIRVHAASQNHPIAGDEKYGARDFNKSIKAAGFKRMFLHARHIELELNGHISVTAPLDDKMKQLVEQLRRGNG